MSAKPLIFLHLPKTAGTTLRAVFAGRYPAKRTWLIGQDINADIENFVALDETQRHRIRLLMGHMSFGLHRYMAPGAVYFTLLREPVSRVWSEYRFLKRNTQHPFHAAIAPMSLEEYLESDYTGQTSNGQTRLLCGNHEPGRPGIAGRDDLDESHLNIALENIGKHFLLAGTQDHLEECLLLLARDLGWLLPPFHIKRNVSTVGGEKPTAEQVQMISVRNELDARLFFHVSQAIDSRISNEAKYLSVARRRFEKWNPVYQRNHARVIQYRNRIVRRFSPG